MNKKIKITPEWLAKNNKNSLGLVVGYIFFVLGTLLIFLPLLDSKPLNKDLTTMAIFFVLGFLPFGYFLGLRNILKIKNFYNQLKNGQYEIIEDTVTNKIMLPKTTSESSEGLDYSFEFENYSKKYNLSILGTNDDNKNINVGDKVYIVVLKNKKGKTSGLFFSKSKYEI